MTLNYRTMHFVFNRLFKAPLRQPEMYCVVFLPQPKPIWIFLKTILECLVCDQTILVLRSFVNTSKDCIQKGGRGEYMYMYVHIFNPQMRMGLWISIKKNSMDSLILQKGRSQISYQNQPWISVQTLCPIFIN